MKIELIRHLMREALRDSNSVEDAKEAIKRALQGQKIMGPDVRFNGTRRQAEIVLLDDQQAVEVTIRT